jgi:predicted GNAT family acetyltransferase
MAALPPRWQLQPQGYLMISKAQEATASSLPNGYHLQSDRNGPTASAQIIAPDGSLAASGHSAEAVGVFIYDRIITAPEHQRRGLGTIIMNALKAHRVSSNTPELLVATEDGRRLYSSLGWIVLSPFSTAVIPS